MRSLYNNNFDVGAIIHISQQSPSHYKEFWSIVIDTGAAVSVCPTTFCEHIPTKPMAEETRKQFVTVTSEGLTIHGLKETKLIIGTITMQVCFIVSNVQSPLIGLPDISDNKTTIHTGAKLYIEQFGNMLPGFHNPDEIQLDKTIHTRYSPTTPTALIVSDIEELSQQASIPRQLRTNKEQEEHRITHMPYRSWCSICVKAKGQPTQHRKGALKEQSDNNIEVQQPPDLDPQDQQQEEYITTTVNRPRHTKT
eukprot:3363104-Amphidinium_carterae.1